MAPKPGAILILNPHKKLVFKIFAIIKFPYLCLPKK